MPETTRFQKGQRLYYAEPGKPRWAIVTFELYDDETPVVLEGNPTAIVGVKEGERLCHLRVRLADLRTWDEYHGKGPLDVGPLAP